MPDVAKLKKKAAEFELKKQFDKALAVYVEIVDSFDPSDSEVDVGLYNRVGDLYLKQGSVGDAVDYYERAVDRYADGGFFNNAIALCNKILRNSPGRASVYYKLGKISAQKGFKGDAKKNFLEYADRMQSAGKTDEAFRALKEFADLCPDQDDIRLMLADQFSRKGRAEEAIEQLQLLYERYTHEGRDTEAGATVSRMKAIDPNVEPRAGSDTPRPGSGDLVFLDLNDSAPGGRGRSSVARRATDGLDIIDTSKTPPRAKAPILPPPPPTLPPPPPPTPAVAQSPVPSPELLQTEGLEPEVLDGVTRVAEFEVNSHSTEAGGLLDGLESTSFAAPEETDEPRGLLDFEPTSLTPMPSEIIPEEPVVLAHEEPAVEAHAALDFDVTEARVPTPVRPSEPVPQLAQLDVDYAAAFDEEPPRVSGSMRSSLAGLPMLVDEEGQEPEPEEIPASSREEEPTAFEAPDDFGFVAEAPDDGAPIGGDLELIMPEATPPRGTPIQTAAQPDNPFIDLHLPVSGEAELSITQEPESLLMLPEIEFQRPALDDIEVSEVAPIEHEEFSFADAVSSAPIEADDSFFAAPVDAAEGIAEPEERDMSTPPAARRGSTIMAERSVELLQALCDADPDDHLQRRRLAEAMLESGDREGGLRELETAMVGFERADDLIAAAKVADEIVLLNPESVRHLQKRVEYAFRTNERGRLIDAYLQLADALFRAGQADKSRAIYQRVIDLSPDDLRAQTALEAFPQPEPAPEPPPPPKSRQTTQMPRASVQAPKRASAPASATLDSEFVNLGDWLRDDEAPKDTRMVVAEQEPTGDEEADFQDMLRKFKQGIAENVDDEDHQSHYDLGVAYKEMGLLDEAIAEFQKALRAPSNRVSTYEALGQCFMEKEQYPMAATILSRALHERGVSDDQLVGVLYLLGRCAEERAQRDAAIEYYQRVFVIDIQFRDVADRLAAIEGASS